MNRLKILREERSLNQADVAKFLEISVPAYYYYESEKRDMSPDTIIKLANFFEVSTDYLLGKTDKRNPDDSLDKDKLYIALSKEDKGYISDEVKSEILQFAQYVIDQEKKKKSDKKEQ